MPRRPQPLGSPAQAIRPRLVMRPRPVIVWSPCPAGLQAVSGKEQIEGWNWPGANRPRSRIPKPYRRSPRRFPPLEGGEDDSPPAPFVLGRVLSSGIRIFTPQNGQIPFRPAWKFLHVQLVPVGTVEPYAHRLTAFPHPAGNYTLREGLVLWVGEAGRPGTETRQDGRLTASRGQRCSQVWRSPCPFRAIGGPTGGSPPGSAPRRPTCK